MWHELHGWQRAWSSSSEAGSSEASGWTDCESEFGTVRRARKGAPSLQKAAEQASLEGLARASYEQGNSCSGVVAAAEPVRLSFKPHGSARFHPQGLELPGGAYSMAHPVACS